MCSKKNRRMSNDSVGWHNNDDYEDWVIELLWPNELEWASVPLFMALLCVGLVGNFLVVFVVIRNAQMRSATNIFLVNLAMSDFLVLLFCLPFSLLWDITKTWWFGTTMCRCMVFMQNLSVTVSVLTLVCISVERWYAICNPMKFKITLRWTLRLLITVWAVGILLSTPEFLTLTTQPYSWNRTNFTTPWLTTCVDTWGPEVNKYYRFNQVFLLFVVPLAVISIFYGNIIVTLWAKSSPSGQAGAKAGGGNAALQQSVVRQDHARRKAAKMLIVVVVLFVICYFPVHTYNVLRELNWVPTFDNKYQIAAVKLSIRFLTYSNSCINPIIYNFMSEKFQREFRRACQCQSAGYEHDRRLMNGLIRLATRVPSTVQSNSPSSYRIPQYGGSDHITEATPIKAQISLRTLSNPHFETSTNSNNVSLLSPNSNVLQDSWVGRSSLTAEMSFV